MTMTHYVLIIEAQKTDMSHTLECIGPFESKAAAKREYEANWWRFGGLVAIKAARQPVLYGGRKSL